MVADDYGCRLGAVRFPGTFSVKKIPGEGLKPGVAPPPGSRSAKLGFPPRRVFRATGQVVDPGMGHTSRSKLPASTAGPDTKNPRPRAQLKRTVATKRGGGTAPVSIAAE